MTVLDAVRTVTVPHPAGAPDLERLDPGTRADAPPALVGRDRPFDADERQFLQGIAATFFVADTVIVTGMLVARHVWG